MSFAKKRLVWQLWLELDLFSASLVGTFHRMAKSEEALVVDIIHVSKAASLLILCFVAIQLIFSVSIYQRYRDKV
ncbi:MAG TPA: hypothetical protein VIF37_02665 [Methylobacter sp.]